MRIEAWVSWAIAQNQQTWLEPSRGHPRKPAQGDWIRNSGDRFTKPNLFLPSNFSKVALIATKQIRQLQG